MIFAFENDFAGTLRCIPMIVRMKLDLCGIKLPLRQWCSFTVDDRAMLVALPCDNDDETQAYRTRVLMMIARRTADAPVFLPPQNHEPWQRPDRMPAEIASEAARCGLAPPMAAHWAALSPLQRFALVKLTRATHENENFAPAMAEFGLT